MKPGTRNAFLAALTIIIVVMFSANWIAKFLMRTEYPATLAARIDGFEDEALINRSTLQRRWPGGLADLSERAQVRNHMARVDVLAGPSVSLAANTAANAAPPPVEDLATLLQSADLDAGERRARICSACHTFEEGGADRVGPNLWAVLGGDIAGKSQFDYSPALSSEPGIWTYEKMDSYLANPGQAVPGNRMAFQGIRRARDRAEIIAYLRAQGANDLPLPIVIEAPDDESGAASEPGEGGGAESNSETDTQN